MGTMILYFLLTIRFREDNHEIRLVYGNQQAIEQMKTHKYTDGARFMKKAYQTTDDKLFPVSQIPTDQVRFQYMWMEKGRWRYDLQDRNGKPIKFVENECVQCHKIAAARGEVFSVPMGEEAFGKPVLTWKTVDADTLSKAVRQRVSGRVDVLTTMLGTAGWVGTLSEIKPVLKAHAKEVKRPAVFMVGEKAVIGQP